MTGTSKSVLASSGISFGTSGARGLVEQFSVQVCAAFSLAFVDVMRLNYTFDRVALGVDRRPSSDSIAAACAGALALNGLKTDFYGVLPTPALAAQALEDKVPAIMVTGSHIPFDRNGLKFYRPDGEISKEDEVAIKTSNSLMQIGNNNALPPLNPIAAENYMQRYLKVFSVDCLKGKRIGLYEHSSAGRELYAQLFSHLGAIVISLGRSEEFVPIDTEAVTEEDKRRGEKWSSEYQLDYIFSSDGDGDRPLLADEQGHWIRGDMLCLMAARYLGIEALAVPVSCNTAIEASGFFKAVERTRIGSPFVLKAMDELKKDYDRVAGFEANGGFLLGSDINLHSGGLGALPTRDALLPALCLMAAAQETGITLSRAMDDLPKRYTASDRIQNFPAEISGKLLNDCKDDPEKALKYLGLQSLSTRNIDTTDGVRLSLNDGSIVHLRPSGNAPELRCYVEMHDQRAANDRVVSCLKKIDSLRRN